MNDKTTLLELLKTGCTIEFPSGYSLRGNPSDGYIYLRTEYGADGLESLDEVGVERALLDERRYAEEKDSEG